MFFDSKKLKRILAQMFLPGHQKVYRSITLPIGILSVSLELILDVLFKVLSFHLRKLLALKHYSLFSR